MPDSPRPEDIPADTDPVCGRCKLPAAWVNEHWVHAELADAAICELLFRGIDA
jgi:hypothetical protein